LTPAIPKSFQKRVDDEVKQLLLDIRRIGDQPGAPHVKFGELFDDDDVQQYYEALVGTLKSAKKRGVIDFKGQMLLKGMHDSVVISLTDDGIAQSISN
jgi:Costars